MPTLSCDSYQYNAISSERTAGARSDVGAVGGEVSAGSGSTAKAAYRRVVTPLTVSKWPPIPNLDSSRDIDQTPDQPTTEALKSGSTAPLWESRTATPARLEPANESLKCPPTNSLRPLSFSAWTSPSAPIHHRSKPLLRSRAVTRPPGPPTARYTRVSVTTTSKT